MATSWNLTALEIINDAYSLIGVKGPRGTLDASLFALGVRTLNGILKELSLHGYSLPGLNLVTQTISWSAGTPSYVTEPDDYSSALTLQRTDANGNKITLTGYDRAGWLSVVNRSATGSYPTHFYLDVDGKAYLWPVPESDPGLIASYIQKVDDVVTTSSLDIPASGVLAMQWGLAAHLAPHFQVDPAPFAAVWVSKRDDLIANGVNTAPVVFELDD